MQEEHTERNDNGMPSALKYVLFRNETHSQNHEIPSHLPVLKCQVAKNLPTCSEQHSGRDKGMNIGLT